jgi:hypothetical protein
MISSVHWPMADFGQRRAQLVAGIAAIGEDMAQPGEAMPDAGEHVGCAVAVLHIGGMDDRPDEEALGIGDDVALPPLDLLARVIARDPPLSVV